MQPFRNASAVLNVCICAEWGFLGLIDEYIVNNESVLYNIAMWATMSAKDIHLRAQVHETDMTTDVINLWPLQDLPVWLAQFVNIDININIRAMEIKCDGKN